MKLKTKDYFFVIVQFLLFAAYLLRIHFWPFETGLFIQVISLLIALQGVVIIIVAILQLNKNLSPFPTPKNNSSLIKTGLYKYIRHPIYTGILFLFFGYGLYINSSFKILISLVLLILFYFKSSYEEKRLKKRFLEYEAYKKSTGRFFPSPKKLE